MNPKRIQERGLKMGNAGQKRRNWSMEETIVAFYVYCTIPFAKSSKTNPVVMHYANLLSRTPSALNMKIGNIGRLDPELKKKNIKGLENGAKMEEIVWDLFINDKAKLVHEAEKIIEKLSDEPIEAASPQPNEKDYSGKEKTRTIRTRIGQGFFRASVLSAYNNTCAITGLQINELLIASHIKPWAEDENNRLNPQNGICLNSIHDKAFDSGLITIDKSYRVVISSKLKEHYSQGFIDDVFKKYESTKILSPTRFKPSPEFLEYHNDVIFKGV